MSDASLVPDDDQEVGLAANPDTEAKQDTEPPGEIDKHGDREPEEDAAQGSVPGGPGAGGETVAVPVGGDGPPIDVPKAAYDDPGPNPITPASSQQQYDARVKYENQVNGQFEAWVEANRGAILDTFLAGGTVELNHLDAEGNAIRDEGEGDAAHSYVAPDPDKDVQDGGQPAASKDDGGARDSSQYGNEPVDPDDDGGLAPKS